MLHTFSVVLWGPFLIFHCVATVEAFSWGASGGRPIAGLESMGAANPSIEVMPRSRLPNIYAVAMEELQELESEPLCHRIAARLLVNNCQLLDGQDEATVLLDSGRQVRDFVDSYAASLAICDLERGSFVIPPSCAPFRELSLAKIPDSKLPRLHVSPQQIDSCLTGLGKSDSAWNTWVNYRHKALRFCEAARSDNEKAQSIRLHQRLTEVLRKLAEGVEQELEAHLQAINTRTAEATEQLQQIIPDIDQLRNRLQEVDRTLSEDVMQLAQDSHVAMRNGLEDAENLQQMLAVLLKTVLSNNAEVAASHEVAISNVRDQTNGELAVVMAALASAAASSTSLHDQMELSYSRVTEIANRQEHLEKGLGRLYELAEDLSFKYATHAEMLTLAHRVSEDLLETLDEMALSASEVSSSLNKRSTWMSWWPYVVCPTASLLMGSYGLPPSAVRNLGLIALGEFAGLLVSYIRYFAPGIWETSRSELSILKEANATLSFIPVENDILRKFPSDLHKTSH